MAGGVVVAAGSRVRLQQNHHDTLHHRCLEDLGFAVVRKPRNHLSDQTLHTGMDQITKVAVVHNPTPTLLPRQ